MGARFLAAAVLFAAVLVGRAGAEPLDLKRYMPASEVQAGMTGVGKTTLQGTEIVEFQVRVLAVLKNAGPKNDLVIIRCSGAGLEESGIIAGMSGSPVYIGGRLIGAVAYAFQWGKLPLAGVQPIDQMLAVSDAKSWAVRGATQAVGEQREAGVRPLESGMSDLKFQITGTRLEISDARRAGRVTVGDGGGADAAVPVPASADRKSVV